jgi:hypothetical protein
MGRILLENLRLVDESLIYVVVLSDNISLEDVLVGLFLGNELVGLVAAGQVVDLGEARSGDPAASSGQCWLLPRFGRACILPVPEHRG